MQLGIVVPVRNEAQGIAHFLAALGPLRAQGHVVIVVDGDSQDDTAATARPLCDVLIQTVPGRAHQMNTGARLCQTPVLLFLHADTFLPEQAATLIAKAMAAGFAWGRFDVRILGRSRWLALIGAMMNLRSRLSSIATGDQAIFVRKEVFDALGGYAELALMEDIELSGRLRTLARPACLRAKVQTSGRRWDERGALRTVFLMWRLRWRYWRGDPVDALAKAYQ